MLYIEDKVENKTDMALALLERDSQNCFKWYANGPESEWTPGVGDGQGGLVCYSPWGRKESDMTEQLN